MADDIVERLRGRASNPLALKRDAVVMEQAADEIERLRAAGDALAEATAWWNRGNDLGDAARVWQEARGA